MIARSFEAFVSVYNTVSSLTTIYITLFPQLVLPLFIVACLIPPTSCIYSS